MFTVKWIVKTPHGETTRMFEAREVAVAIRDDPPPPEKYVGPDVAPKLPKEWGHWEVADRSVDQALFIMDPYEPNFSGRSFDVGIVYVMNETGATVGKYVLNDIVISDPQPLQMVA